MSKKSKQLQQDAKKSEQKGLGALKDLFTPEMELDTQDEVQEVQEEPEVNPGPLVTSRFWGWQSSDFNGNLPALQGIVERMGGSIQTERLDDMHIVTVAAPEEVFSHEDFAWFRQSCRLSIMEGELPPSVVESFEKAWDAYFVRLNREAFGKSHPGWWGCQISSLHLEEVLGSDIQEVVEDNGGAIAGNCIFLPQPPEGWNKMIEMAMAGGFKFLWRFPHGQLVRVWMEGQGQLLTSAIFLGSLDLGQEDNRPELEPERHSGVTRRTHRISVEVLEYQGYYSGPSTPRSVEFGYYLDEKQGMLVRKRINIDSERQMAKAPFNRLQVKRVEETRPVGNVPSAKFVRYEIDVPEDFPYNIFLAEEVFTGEDLPEEYGQVKDAVWKSKKMDYHPIFKAVKKAEPYALTMKDIRDYLATLSPGEIVFTSSHSGRINLAQRVFEWKFPDRFGDFHWFPEGMVDNGSDPGMKFDFSMQVYLFLYRVEAYILDLKPTADGVKAGPLVETYREEYRLATKPRVVESKPERKETGLRNTYRGYGGTHPMFLYYGKMWESQSYKNILAAGRDEDGHFVFLYRDETHQVGEVVRLTYPINYKRIGQVYTDFTDGENVKVSAAQPQYTEWYVNHLVTPVRANSPFINCSFPSFTSKPCELVTTVGGQDGQIQLMLSTEQCIDGAMQITVQTHQREARSLLFVVVSETGQVYNDPYCHLPFNVQQLKEQGEDYRARFALYPFDRLYVLESTKFDGKLVGPVCTLRSLAAFEFVRKSGSKPKDAWLQVSEERLTPFFVFKQEQDGRWGLLKSVTSSDLQVHSLKSSYKNLAERSLPILAAGNDGQGNFAFLAIRDGEVVRLWYPKNFRKVWLSYLAFMRREEVKVYTQRDVFGVQYAQWCVDQSNPLSKELLNEDALTIKEERFPSFLMDASALHKFSILDKQRGEMVDVRLSAQRCVSNGMQVQIHTSRPTSALFAVVSGHSTISNYVDHEGFYPPNVRQVFRKDLNTWETSLVMFPGDRLCVLDSPHFKGAVDPARRYVFSPLAAFRLEVNSQRRGAWQRVNASRRERYALIGQGGGDWRSVD